MRKSKQMAAIVILAATVLLAGSARIASAYGGDYDNPPPRYQEHHARGYNDEYIFATTKMVSEWDVEPALKVPLFPPAVVIDLVFLPAEMIAGCF
jgi:hypothetical protein